MPLVAMQAGQLRVLKAFLDGTPMYCFPYRNDRTPSVTDTLAAYQEANFSGYSGAKNMGPWPAATYAAFRAQCRGPSLSWSHDGGEDNNNIYGVVWVQTAGGILLFAERDPRAPVVVDQDHRTYTYTPAISVRAEYAP